MVVALDPGTATRPERRFAGEHEPSVEVVEETSRERFLEMSSETVRS
jgi:hypothetical protein